MNIKTEPPKGFLKEQTFQVPFSYTVTAKMKKVWAVELDLLQEFIRVCEENGLTYYADGGTLLGAARHGGFIPWDDDMDLAMPRKDYDRLNELAPKVFRHPYFWQSPATERDSVFGWCQLRNSETTGISCSTRKYGYSFHQGIAIDIFPLDFLPEDPEECDAFFDKVKIQYKKMKVYANHTTLWRDMRKYTGIKHMERLLKHIWLSGVVRAKENPEAVKYERLRQRYNKTPTSKITEALTLDGLLKAKRVFDISWYRSTVDLPFEWLQIKAPIEYENCLTASYGSDWRTPHMGASLHEEIFFDPDKPYTDYRDTVWKERLPIHRLAIP